MMINEMLQAAGDKAVELRMAAERKAAGFLTDERGDTNFISIIVILGIALLVATVFIGFKDQIIDQAKIIIESFTIH
jgi:hypothetical protein